MRTLVIGRSPFADVVIADASVAPHHAELVVTDEGRLHLTDCASETGTWLLRPADEATGSWQAIRQAFIASDDPLRFGDHHCTVRDLLKSARDAPPRANEAMGTAGHPGEGGRQRLRGRVERDAVTGEIVRRRP